jgi:hypothetical protein
MQILFRKRPDMALRKIEGPPYSGYNAESDLKHIELSLLKVILILGLVVEDFEKYSIDEIINAIDNTFTYGSENNTIAGTGETYPVYIFLRKHGLFLKEHCKRLWFWKQLAKFEVENV